MLLINQPQNEFAEGSEVRCAYTVWFTGLSGAGKSTLAGALGSYLETLSLSYEVIDGDELRRELSCDLGFTKEDRQENIRRISYLARLLNRHHIIAIVAAIAPYREAREEVRSRIGHYVEVHVDCSLETLVRRDEMGLYQRALIGEIGDFSGISQAYEAPLSPEVYINSDFQSKEESLAAVVCKLEELDWIPRKAGAEVTNARMQPDERQLTFLDQAVRTGF